MSSATIRKATPTATASNLAVVIACLPLLLATVGTGCTFFKRAISYPAVDPIMDGEWYEPCEAVPGNPKSAIQVSSEAEIRIPRQALEGASDYARRSDSCALLILNDGKIVFERYWCGMSASTRVNAMSMTKTVVGMLVGVAIEQGHLVSEDQPVSAFLPEWRNDPRGRITIRDLLQMTSGLKLGNMISIHLGTEALTEALSTPLEDEPGMVFRYSNVNTLLLGVILERATGQRLADYLSEKLWKPLGATDASVWLDAEGGTTKAYCCLMATAHDWARVGLMMQNRGRVGDKQVVPAAWIDRMLRPSPMEENYGYQVWLGYSRPACRFKDWSVPFATADTYMLAGQQEQRVFVVPSHKLVVVRLGHENEDWDDPRIPNLLVNAIRSSSPILNPYKEQGGTPIPVAASGCDHPPPEIAPASLDTRAVQ